MTHTKEYLEEKYATPDPWGYQTNPEDALRKKTILGVCPPSEVALEIGAGEGWITKDLPAKHLFATELSEVARERIPKPVQVLGAAVDWRFHGADIVLLAGVLYAHYNWLSMWEQALHAVRTDGVIVTCNIFEHEVAFEPTPFLEKELEFTFPYRDTFEHIVRWRSI